MDKKIINEEKAKEFATTHDGKIIGFAHIAALQMAQWKDSQIALKISKAYKEGFRSGFKAATLLLEDFKNRMEDEKD